jgi:short-chain fatty acids transporter
MPRIDMATQPQIQPEPGSLERFATLISHWVPDALTAGVVLTFVTMAVAAALGNPLAKLLEAYHQGLWMLLPFTMQMTLILVLSLALASTPLLRRGFAGLARIPKTRNQFIALAFLSAGCTAYLYWGLGYASSPMIAIYFAAEAERKGVEIDFPFLLAVTSAAQALWQYGLSSSAPLLVASPGHFLESTIGVIPLSTTIWSPAAILQEVLFAAAAIVLACRIMPVRGRPISHFPASLALAKAGTAAPADNAPAAGFAQRLEASPWVPLSFCLPLAGWLAYHFVMKRLGHDINSLNVSLLLLALLLHRTVRRFAAAVETAAGRSWAVIVLYHVYAGVAGLIQYTNTGDKVARMAASIASRATFPLITAAAGAVFACFIPSSGGQWTVQGFVTVKTAMGVGVSVQRGMLALGVGDHVGNFITPFWYVVVAGIARVDFRSFFGYGVLFGALWFAIGVVVFTFAPC